MLGRLEGSSYVKNFSGHVTECLGTAWANLCVAGIDVRVKVIGAKQLLQGIDVVLGMDVMQKIGPVTIHDGKVELGNLQANAASALALVTPPVVVDTINDKDFTANFDGVGWTVKWKWKGGSIPRLTNGVDHYGCKSKEIQEDYEKEVNKWIDEGILVPWTDEVEGVLPLMVVVQPTKKKVRPVLDFRELNQYVECHTGDDEINICSERLREWRKTKGELELVDLQSAYLQIRVDKDLWKHQIVKFGGKTYCLTRLGFGLNVAPRIMAVILKRVLSKDDRVKSSTSSYVDDILVNTSQVTSAELVSHLDKYGLKSKPPEKLDGGAALGLRLRKLEDGSLEFTRGNEVPEIPDTLTRRELFSICGKMVGHYPVAGWLRVACSYIKREALGVSWDEDVGDRARNLLHETRARIKTEDPVRGAWTVPSEDGGILWCDASSLATGAILEVGGVVVEDRAWLRKKTDYNHINVAELDSLVKGVNMAVDWGVKNLHIKTDSSTVKAWVQLALSEERPVRTKGAAEVLVKRRLGILKELEAELKMTMTVELVASECNKSDSLTRVPKAWLAGEKTVCSVSIMQELHDKHHMGVDRTLFLARKLDPSIRRADVKEMIRGCEECQSIDPAPGRHEAGALEVDRNWNRLAIDVTHYRGVPYLTMVDCGPGRFALWRELKRESSQCIVLHLQEVFRERGPVDEVVMDNGAAFHSRELRQLFEYWKVVPFYRAAYRPSGNAIVERHHRTIKRWAEKAGIEPAEAVFWYNVAPRTSLTEESVPQQAIHTYEWRLPLEEPRVDSKGEIESIKVGDHVWVKPGHARCTTKWAQGRVTSINSKNNVSVDGMPRHVLDVRPVFLPVEGGESDGDQVEADEDAPPVPRRSGRVRRPPPWLADYASQ